MNVNFIKLPLIKDLATLGFTTNKNSNPAYEETIVQYSFAIVSFFAVC